MQPRNTAIRPLLLGLTIVAGLMLIWAAGCSSEAPTPPPIIVTASPEIDPRFLTATSIVDRATAHANPDVLPTNTIENLQVTVVTNTPTLTPEPVQLTARALTRAPLYKTATAIVARATEVAMTYAPTLTAEILTETAVDPDKLTAYVDLVHTATAIVEEATAITFTPTPTQVPIPTLSAEETEALHQRWLNELEGYVGFSHPVFDPIVDQLILSTRSRHLARWRDSSYPQPEIESVDYEGITYLAVIARNSYIELQSRLLLFRMVNGEPELIPDPVTTSPVGYILSFEDWENYLGGFMDRNGNGYPDLAIFTTTGGSHPTVVDVLLEIRPGGEVVDITPFTSDYGRARAFLTDLEDDGVFEYGAWRCLPTPFNPTCPDMYYGPARYFAWDGNAYVEITGSLDVSYWPEINAFWESVATQDGCLLPSYDMYDMLLAHFVRDELADAWARLEPMLRWDECTAEQLERYGEDMDDLVKWVNERLDSESQPK